MRQQSPLQASLRVRAPCLCADLADRLLSYSRVVRMLGDEVVGGSMPRRLKGNGFPQSGSYGRPSNGARCRRTAHAELITELDRHELCAASPVAMPAT
jgi:hypothetical protein